MEIRISSHNYMADFDKSIFDDNNKFQQFIDADQHIRLINRWEYAGKVNNHTEFANALQNIQLVSQELPVILEKAKLILFYNEFLTPNNIKLVYRCLNQQRVVVKVAMLKILIDLINTISINHFINIFNLELSFLPKLVAKTDTTRNQFIKFWITIGGKLSFLDRKSYLGSKVWTNIFKLLNEDDKELQLQLLVFLDMKVLQERNFNKFTKLKFFNESVLFNLQSNVDIPEYLDLFHKIIDSRYGILFIEPPNSLIAIKGETFKINNKTLYNLLTFIKIDSVAKIKLALLIVSQDYNLIDPYMSYLIFNYGSGLTANYYYVLLFTRILELPTCSLPTVMLKTINKSDLQKNLKSDAFVKYMNLYLIYLVINKLVHLKPLEVKTVLDFLPHVTEILNVKGNKIIELMVLKIISKLSLYTDFNTNLSKFVITKLENIHHLQGINFQKFNLLITTQINLSSRFQIKSNNFSQIIKLSNTDSNHLFFYNILNKLVTLECDNLLNPLWSFVYLSYPSELLPLLKELMARLNNPYKYIDMPFNVHLVIKIFLEQYSHYISKNVPGELVSDWFNLLVLNFVLLGENKSEIVKLIDHLQLQVEFIDTLPNNNSISDLVINNGNFHNKFIMNDFDLICVVSKLKHDPIPLFVKVSKYINDHHVNNMNLFKSFLINERTIHMFNDLLKDLQLNIWNPEIKTFIFESLKKDDSLLELNWILDDSQLNYKFKESIQLRNYQLLISKFVIPEISIDELFSFKSSRKFDIIKEKLNSNNLHQHLSQIIDNDAFHLLQGLYLSDDVIDSLNQCKNPKMYCYISCTNPKIRDLFQNIELKQLKNKLQDDLYWKLVDNCLRWNPDLLLHEDINDLFKTVKAECFKPEAINLAVKWNQPEWTRNTLIQITKVFAEKSPKDVPPEFDKFLYNFTKLLPIEAPDLIDTQLEVILSSPYVDLYEYLSFVNGLILTTKINNNKLLELFLNNPRNVLHGSPTNENAHCRIESSMVIYNLFKKDNANIRILKQILPMYLGSIRFEDLILKQILTTIESITNINWLSLIKGWEFNQLDNFDFELVGYQRFIVDELICLNKTFITNALKSNLLFSLPFHSDAKTNYQEIINYVNSNIFKMSYDYFSTIYDYEFLMLLILNNEEFFKFNEKVVVNYKNFINSEFLELVITNYNLSPIAPMILSGLMANFDNDDFFKDKALFKVYLANLGHTFRSYTLTNIQLKIYSRFIPILANPGHYLYEVIYKYVLSHPIIKPDELPIFNIIKNDSLKTIEWYVDNFEYCIEEDIWILNKNKIFEWLFNLLNIKNIPKSLFTSINKVLFVIPNIDGGTTTLVTKYGGLGFFDQINNPITATKFSLTASKRLIEWTNDDFSYQIKRIKH